MTVCPTIKLVKQLTGVPAGSRNCGPATAAMVIDFASCGKLRASPTEMRRRMQPTDTSGFTNLDDMKKAVESFDIEASDVELAFLRLDVHWRDRWENAKDALETGDVFLAWIIDYSVINDDIPRLSGDKEYRQNHVVGTRFIRTFKGKRQIRVFDPLADGRRKGIPKGPSWWPLDTFLKAARAVTGGDGVDFAIAKRARAIPHVGGRAEQGA